jgi:uncharacterized protein YfaS (alpha-2-macroglobulin family)
MSKLSSFWSGVKSKFSGAGRFLRDDAPQKIFGEFHWKAPAWIPVFRERSAALILKRPEYIIGGILGFFIISGGGYYGYNWWQNRPKPDYVTYTISTPTPPSLDEKEPPSSVTFKFGKSVAALKHGKAIPADQISISPPIEGEWTWKSESVINFVPKQEWPIGKKYKVHFEHTLFSSETLLEDWTPWFMSAAFSAEISHDEFYQNPQNRKQKQVIVHVSFTHPVDPDAFKKRVSMKYDDRLGSKIPFDVTFGKKNREGYIVSKNLALPERDTDVLVKVSDGYSALGGGNDFEQKLETTVKVPGVRTFFRVSSADLQLIPNEKLDTDQILSVVLTDEISESDFKKGFAVSVLPDRKDKEGKPTPFTSEGEVTPAILKESTPAEFEMIPNEKDYGSVFNFKIHQPVGKILFVTVAKGMKSLGDFETALEYRNVVQIPNYPALLKIQQTGGILSYSGEKKLAIALRGIKKYRVALARVESAELANLMSQTGGTFTGPQFLNYRFNFENVSESFSEDHDSGVEDGPESGKLRYGSIDLGKYLHGTSGSRGLFHIRLTKLNEKGEEQGTQDERLVLVTDLGLLVKKNSDRSREVFVQSVANGGPVSGVRIEVLGKNGITVLAATTDASGRVTFPDLDDFRKEKEPVAFVAKLGGDLSFIPYDVRDRGLNFSRFDTNGVESSGGKNALSAYLFSERGIYRPGDEMNLGFIVKSENWSKKTAGVPVEASIKDARGMNVYRERMELNAQGFGSFRFVTMDTAPTGVYSAELYLIEKDDGKSEKRTLLGATPVKVEEFIPDTMKIAAHLSRGGKPQDSALGWVSPADLHAIVNLGNLYGTPAVDHKVTASYTLTPAFPKAPQFKDYRFFDPKLAEKSYTERLDEKKTDEHGEAEFDLDLSRFEAGTYRMSFDAEGLALEGGRSVGVRTSVIVSPLEHILGYKSTSNLDYLKLNSKADTQILALGAHLKPTAVKGTKIFLQEMRTLSVLARDNDGAFRYQSVRKAIPISEGDFTLTKGGTNYGLKTDAAGTFAVIVKDSAAKEILKFEYTVIGQSNVLKKLERNAELQIKLGKTDYDAGEEIEMQITAPYTGAGLITIEREKVHAVKWFKTNSTNSIQKIRVPASLEGSAYVQVTFVRDLGSTEIFTSPLSYGVVPFSVSRKRREITVELEAPTLVKPGDKLEITYKTSKPAKIVVFGADEGILQVAGYKKPDPLSYFFRKHQLEVQTSQLLDLILPEFSVIKGVSSSGGDADGGLGKNLNPFKRKTDKPVVFWSGIIDSSAEKRKFEYTVPDYFNGQIHVFAVAVNEGAVGVGEDATTVKGDYIISPVAPLFTTPKDEFDVGVAVANNLVGSGKDAPVELTIKASPELQIIGDSTAKLKITEGREGGAHFRVKTLDKLGAGKLEFTAGNGSKMAHYKLEMSVEPAAPHETTLRLGSLKNDHEEFKFTRSLYPEYGKRVASVSALPLAFSNGLTQYLVNNPYGCTEQLLSKAFPILILRGRKDFAKVTTENAKSLETMAALLRSRQTGEGGFSTWSGQGSVNEFYTAYATHFMLEAQERGYPLPTEVRTRALDYIKGVALEGNPTSLSDARLKAYELYLVARAGIVQNNVLVSLREKLDKDLKGWKGDVTAIFLAGVYKLYHQDAQALELITGMELGNGQSEDYEHYVDGLFRDGIYLDILSRHFKEKLTELSAKQIEHFIEPIRKGSYNTISSAIAILGLDAYATAIQSSGILKAIAITEKEKEWRPLETSGEAILQSPISLAASSLKIDNPSDSVAFYQVVESGFDREPSTSEVHEGLEVSHSLTDLDGKEVKTAKVGQTYVGHLRFRSFKKNRLNVAIIDRIPSGFEIILDRTRPTSHASEEDSSSSTPASHPTSEEGEGGETTSPSGGEGEEGAFWLKLLPTSAYADESFIPEYLDLREDRLIVYAHVTTDIQEFTYQLKATNAGKFVIPAVYAEDMYDRTAHARSEAGRIEVESAK